MAKRIVFVVLEALVVFISAILGAFAWNHLSPIFNSMDWWDGLINDIASNRPAYIVIGALCFILVAVLYFAKAETTRQEKILEALAKKLGAEQMRYF